MRLMIRCLIMLVLPFFLWGQLQDTDRYDEYGELLVAWLESAPFPHPERADGYRYQGNSYSYAEHYSDNSVAIFIPDHYQQRDSVDFVVFLHGWFDNVADALSEYRLIQQFVESGKNAILVVPQGPKNAPDSFGGQLEERNGFSDMMTDIIKLLKNRQLIDSEQIGKIILAAHGGGYQVVSTILMQGGLASHIRAVHLFDALYRRLERFVYWMCRYEGRILDIYLADGGTAETSRQLIKDLQGWQIPYYFIKEADISPMFLNSRHMVFIESTSSREEILYADDQFAKFIKFSILPDAEF